MFQKNQTPEQRIQLFRDMRRQYQDTGADVNQIIGDLGTIPVQRRYLDYYNPASWPIVFDIVHQGLFCQSGITLVMTSMLIHLGLLNTSTVCMPVISSHVENRDGLVLYYQDRYYNLIAGESVSAAWAQEHSTEFDRHVIAIDKFTH